MELFTLKNIQKLGLALGIIIILNLFFQMGVRSFYPEPHYEDFCKEELTNTIYDTQESCEDIGGKWISTFTQQFEGEAGVQRIVPQKAIDDTEFKPYCDPTASCRKDFEEVNKIYNRDVFIILVILGGIAVVASFFTTAASAVSTGLLYGGLFTFFIASVRFWSDMNEFLRLIILAIVLVVLIYVGYKKLSDKT